MLEAVKNVHAVIDKEIAGGIKPENVYICGFSQGGDLPFFHFLLIYSLASTDYRFLTYRGINLG